MATLLRGNLWPAHRLSCVEALLGNTDHDLLDQFGSEQIHQPVVNRIPHLIVLQEIPQYGGGQVTPEYGDRLC
jgi:hypothetical protein